MSFAVLADIHGNAPALRAVLADMARLGIEQAVNLGDLFSGPIDPVGTAHLLLERDFPTIRGNHDRWLIEQDPSDMGPSDRVAFEALEHEHLNWVRSLPETAKVFGDVFLCHGTPSSDTTYWLERVERNGLLRRASRSEVEREAVDIDANLILCAHSHVPRCVRLADGRVVMNPGSVGCPAYEDDEPVPHLVETGSPNASYVIVGGEGRNRNFTFRSIPYEFAEAAKMARGNGRGDWEHALATGWMDASSASDQRD